MLTFNTFKTALNAISLQFDALKKSFDGIVERLSSTEAAIPAPDWDESDPESKNYVRNRPFYTGDIVETELFDICALADAVGASWLQQDGVCFVGYNADNSVILIDTPIVGGNEYIIEYNGVSYNFIAVDGSTIEISDAIFIGDVDGFSNGVPAVPTLMLYPYNIFDPSDTSGRYMLMMAVVPSDTVPTELKVIGRKQEIVKIDSKYIDFPVETDPTVPEWAKQDTKPKYTASEVGALPKDTKVPFIVTVDETGKVDKTFDNIYRVAKSGAICLLIHKGLYNRVFLLERSSGLELTFVAPYSDNNNFQIYESGETSLTSTSFEKHATNNDYGIVKIGSGLDINIYGSLCVNWIMNSSTEGSTKKFKLTVDDSGTLSTTEVT